MSRSLLNAVAALSLGSSACSSAPSPSVNGVRAGWTLTWSDEFDAADGAPADATKWTAVTGGDGFGNAELEFYTAEAANVHHEAGSLAITADTTGLDGKMCWYGPCTHSSARLHTKGKFEQEYGRFEARIQIPRGQGIWPAFWMLGANDATVPWPGCGEIDIMENVGKEPRIVHGSLHGPGYAGGGALTHPYGLPSGEAFASDYHVYAIEWDAKKIRFFVDDILYQTRSAEDTRSRAAAHRSTSSWYVCS